MSDPITLQDIYDLFRTSQAETDRRAAAADRRLKRLECIAANTSREVAGLTTRWGQFVENLVEPAAIRLFQGRGMGLQATTHVVVKIRHGQGLVRSVIYSATS